MNVEEPKWFVQKPNKSLWNRNRPILPKWHATHTPRDGNTSDQQGCVTCCDIKLKLKLCWHLSFRTVKIWVFFFLPEFSAVSHCLPSRPSLHVSQIFTLSLSREFHRRIYRKILKPPGKQWGWGLHLGLGASSRTRTRSTERRDNNPWLGKTLSRIKEGFCSWLVWATWAPNQAGRSNSLRQLLLIAFSLFKSLFADNVVVLNWRPQYCILPLYPTRERSLVQPARGQAGLELLL